MVAIVRVASSVLRFTEGRHPLRGAVAALSMAVLLAGCLGGGSGSRSTSSGAGGTTASGASAGNTTTTGKTMRLAGPTAEIGATGPAPLPGSLAAQLDASLSGRRVLQVGPTRSVTTLAAASAAALDGDVIEIDGGMSYAAADVTFTQNDLVIRGVGGRPRLDASLAQPTSALLVTSGRNVRIEGLELVGAKWMVPVTSTYSRESGIALQQTAGTLLVRDVLFRDNGRAIQSTGTLTTVLEIRDSVFSGNGRVAYSPTGSSGEALIWTNAIGRFVMEGSHVDGAALGSQFLRSGAKESWLRLNRFTDRRQQTDPALVEGPDRISFPFRGVVVMTQNILEFADKQTNGGTLDRQYVTFGDPNQRASHADNRLAFSHNTIVNFASLGTTPYAIWSVGGRAGATVTATNNLVVGWAQIDPYTALQVTTTGELAAGAEHMAEVRTGDFRLRESGIVALAQWIDPVAPNPPGEVNGVSLVPTHEYVGPGSYRAITYRNVRGALQSTLEDRNGTTTGSGGTTDTGTSTGTNTGTNTDAGTNSGTGTGTNTGTGTGTNINTSTGTGTSGSRVLRVGPTQAVRTLADAARLAVDGDTVEVDANGDYTGDVADWPQSHLTIRGVNGRPRVIAAPGRFLDAVSIGKFFGVNTRMKALFVTRGANVTIENMAFSGARYRQLSGTISGAGVYLATGSLVIRDSVFTDNDHAVSTSERNLAATLEIRDSDFRQNGIPILAATDAQLAWGGIFVQQIGRFTLEGSTVRRASAGNLVGSLAKENLVRWNRITDEGGNAMRALVVPYCGRTVVVGNVIERSNPQPVLLPGDDLAGASVVTVCRGQSWGDSQTAGTASLANQVTISHNTIVNAGVGPAALVQTGMLVLGTARIDVVGNLLVGSGWIDAGERHGVGAGPVEGVYTDFFTARLAQNFPVTPDVFAAPATGDWRPRTGRVHAPIDTPDVGTLDGVSMAPSRQPRQPVGSDAATYARVPGAYQTLAP